jgi:hypothetical protein
LADAFTDLDRNGRYKGWPLTPGAGRHPPLSHARRVTQQWLLAPDQVDLVGTVRSQITLCADVAL